MADPSLDPDSNDEPGTPRWVKVFGIIFGAVVLLFLILLFTRGPHRGTGDHTPSRHFGGHTPPDGGPQ